VILLPLSFPFVSFLSSVGLILVALSMSSKTDVFKQRRSTRNKAEKGEGGLSTVLGPIVFIFRVAIPSVFVLLVTQTAISSVFFRAATEVVSHLI
jgi:hypothetical protein